MKSELARQCVNYNELSYCTLGFSFLNDWSDKIVEVVSSLVCHIIRLISMSR